MSYKFSRRDFMKYSALTVVAVAGAGLLSGCEVQDPNNPVVEIGKTNAIGTTKAKLSLAGTELDGNFKLDILNSADARLFVSADRFALEVAYKDIDGNEGVCYNSAYYPNSSDLEVTCENATPDIYPYIPKNTTVTLSIKAKSFKLPTDPCSYTVTFKYIPYQPEYSMSWKTTGNIENTSASEGGDSTDTDGE